MPLPSGPPLPTGVVVSAQLKDGQVAVAHLTNGTFQQRQAKRHIEYANLRS